jgi:hypothetical protein
MKKKPVVFMVFGLTVLLTAGVLAVTPEVKEKTRTALIEKFGPGQQIRIAKGVEQTAALWRAEDGDDVAFQSFCLENYIADPIRLELFCSRLNTNYESLNGHLNKISLDLKRPLHLDLGVLLTVDQVFGQFEPTAHLLDDFFANKIAFAVLLNFPSFSLTDKSRLGPEWSRLDWAYARLGDQYILRIPATAQQQLADRLTAAEFYISEYNICMDRLVDKNLRTFFPAGMKLLSHWNLRDELKSQYIKPDGLFKQKMVYQVMNRIIDQTIPVVVVNNPASQWDPFTNTVYRDGHKIDTPIEPDTRYRHLLENYQGMTGIDRYSPLLPTAVQRRFETEREIPEAEVVRIFDRLMASPEVRQAGKLISRRLGRKLQPFDIWYNGFSSRPKIDETELDKLCKAKYPDVRSFEKDIPDILQKLGFSASQAAFIAPRITVDPARGSGHAWGAQMKSEQSHLRTRIASGGMDYKGFNIAIHELGHNVEQTLSLQLADHYVLGGVPNTAFTEAFAFVFQDRDLQVLGLTGENQDAMQLKALDSLWNSYEIMGVALLDTRVWNWMYQTKPSTPAQVKAAVLQFAKEIWNQYYADVFGCRDQTILAIYSHLIEVPLYLPDYPLGHLIEFQIAQYLQGKNLGTEMERMCRAGRIIPQLWMKNAVGTEISAEPLLKAAAVALKVIKK